MGLTVPLSLRESEGPGLSRVGDEDVPEQGGLGTRRPQPVRNVPGASAGNRTPA